MKNLVNKNTDAYKTISEVAKELNLINPKNGKLNTHTIRFWEKMFKQIKPILLSGRRRYYDKKNIEILKNIKFLLKEKGYTITGVKKIIDNQKTFALDENDKKSIKHNNFKFKSRLKKISNLVKEIKKLG